MNLYPALKAKMGFWDYYIVRMTMRDVAQEVNFASELLTDPALDDAIQRTLNEGRAKHEIAQYLSGRNDRFFSSLVVAALGGKPQFFPVSVEARAEQAVLAGTEFDDIFGVLRFHEDRQYYALDGQHRLKAIKSLLFPGARGKMSLPTMPEGFADEQISVLMVCGERHDPDFIKEYRRLFSSLNRYAKPTDPDTNITMDEDDMFAILTRRLINDHSFFKSKGNQYRVQTEGKQITKRWRRQENTCFTTLQTLYAMNVALLRTLERGHNESWYSPNVLKNIKRSRPDEDRLDEYYLELERLWDAVISAIPVLQSSPETQRDFSSQGLNSANLLFMPLGQEVMAQIARELLNNANGKVAKKALAPLSSLEWRLNQPPWKYLFLEPNATGGWKMRVGEREPARQIALRILRWMLGLASLDEEEQIFSDWCDKLTPSQDKDKSKEMWQEVQRLQQKISGK